ncbi:hypothetical protein [Actinomadura sp. WMMB 499]|uniref:hypothetical protein n=1 Tax=Actinomadura sp. WMMB 499 TaxID=1219491 RepID=UPI001246798B|nr:hypothetical protein [Actinomadura sp. WMMB 499]QFG22902.1 hypothetical protein F7P10_19055 [Actinomadura sp. WMMB 499]
MGLGMVVGLLADMEAQGDVEYADTVRAEFALIGELLVEAGAGSWDEPRLTAQDVQAYGMGYSGLHTVRRLAVHLARRGRLPEPLEDFSRAAKDRLLKKAYARMPDGGPFDHLVHHSDCEGYYVPVPFDALIVDERLTGGWLGSSVRLLDEVRRIAAALELPEDLDPDSEEVDEVLRGERRSAERWRRYGVESFTCLQLIGAAKHSLATGAAIAFT